ncbi:hypothetical protein [Paenibacillus sp. SYP-B4298]|uniref:hypothetical protein n=1 Tax=Paenibacillus sp. SYP-B4298 TaxID=2996034 RepID=UPI0022DE45A1|nr:hypothetical protein [Paenibacillus sp. SYP-B4298]
MTIRGEMMKEAAQAAISEADLPRIFYPKGLHSPAVPVFTEFLADNEKLQRMQAMIPTANPWERRLYFDGVFPEE